MRTGPEEHPLAILGAAAADGDELACLHARLFEPGWDAASFAKLLAHPASLAFVARLPQPRAVVGFIMAQVAGGEAEILTLGVHKDRQRQGIATRLLAAILCAAGQRKLERLYLEVAASNRAAIAFYQRAGFAPIGRRAAYYQRARQRAEDALLLARAL